MLLADAFAPKKGKKDDEDDDKPDPAAEQEAADKLGYALRDVQAFYDILMVQGIDEKEALARTKRKFKLKRIKVSPIGVVQAPGVPNPPPPKPPAPPAEPSGGEEEPEDEPEEEPEEEPGTKEPTGPKGPPK